MAEINAGLGNLKELKAFILAESMRSSTDFDEQLTIIGLGTAGMMEERCNRVWAYAEGIVKESPANVSFLLADNYPLNMAVAPTIELCSSWVNGAPSWVPATDAIQNVTADAGLVQFSGIQGNYQARIRMTYNGGFWWLGLDATTSLPTGATPVPDKLKLAWLLQCQALWQVRDNLGLAVAGTGSVQFVTLTLSGYEFSPEVDALLKSFIRYKIGG